jgi:hypothetical protein
MEDREPLALRLASTAAAKNVDGESLSQKSARQYLRLFEQAKFLFGDVADRFANRAHQVMV